MKKQDTDIGGQVVNIADARVRRQKPKAPPPPQPGMPFTVTLPDLTDVGALFDMAFGFMSIGDSGLKQLRKGLHKDFGKKERATIRKVAHGFLKHLGPDDTHRFLKKAGMLLVEAGAVLAEKDTTPPSKP